MSKRSDKKSKDGLGVNLDMLDTFRFGIILGAIGIIFWGIINILKIWEPSFWIDVLMSVVYLLFIVSGITILIDYLMARRE